MNFTASSPTPGNENCIKIDGNLTNTDRTCSCDFHWWVNQFCFNKSPEDKSIESDIIAAYFVLEILVSIWFFIETFSKIKKIETYDERNPDDLTYCKLSSKMIRWIRIELIFIIITRVVQIFSVLLKGDFKNFYYYKNEPNTTMTYDFC